LAFNGPLGFVEFNVNDVLKAEAKAGVSASAIWLAFEPLLTQYHKVEALFAKLNISMVTFAKLALVMFTPPGK